MTKWDPVLDRAYDSPEFSALAGVLSTPLMVALARAIFSDANADPAELLGYTQPTVPSGAITVKLDFLK